MSITKTQAKKVVEAIKTRGKKPVKEGVDLVKVAKSAARENFKNNENEIKE